MANVKKFTTLVSGLPKTIDLTDNNVLQTFQIQIVNAGVTASKPLKLDSDKKFTSGDINLTNEVTGTLPIANGGTGSATQNFVDLTEAQTVGGIKTFTSFPVTPSSAPTTDYQTSNKKYVDDQIDAHLVGALIYKGTFDASAGDYDAIVDPSAGWFYKVSVAGLIGSYDFKVGDNLYINKDVTGSPVEADVDHIDNIDIIASVNGKVGTVVLVTDDISEDVSPVNLWFTDTRAKTAAVVNSMAGTQTDQAPSVSSVKSYVAALPLGYNDVAIVAGESFDANKTYAIRWALDGETAGRIYKADKDEEDKPGQFWARGVIQPTSALSAGDPVGQIVKSGRLNLLSGDTNVASSANGKPLFLQNEGAMTEISPETGVTTGDQYASVICGSVVSYNATVTSTVIEINLAGNPLVAIDIAE